MVGPVRVGIVVIGRNEGERLRRCLLSIDDTTERVYVDSGSTDGSQALARDLGFEVVELDTTEGFTAARARNAGARRLAEAAGGPEFIQFIDGDCELQSGWLEAGLGDFADDTAVVFGRRRERFPDRNGYHRSCDLEWAVTPGHVVSCGGDAMFRTRALQQVGGYNDRVIAGEEPELCLRLRRAGWSILSNGREMTLHDVSIDRLSQWWRRAKRTGFGFGSLVTLHGPLAEPSWTRLLVSALAWSAVMGGLVLAAFVFVLTESRTMAIVFATLALLLLLGVGRTAWAKRAHFRRIDHALQWSALLFIAKLAQSLGMLSHLWQNVRARPARIIEYK